MLRTLFPEPTIVFVRFVSFKFTYDVKFLNQELLPLQHLRHVARLRVDTTQVNTHFSFVSKISLQCVL
jgi:hypothetical protein